MHTVLCVRVLNKALLNAASLVLRPQAQLPITRKAVLILWWGGGEGGHSVLTGNIWSEDGASRGTANPRTTCAEEHMVLHRPFYFTMANSLMGGGHNHTISTLTPTIIC